MVRITLSVVAVVALMGCPTDPKPQKPSEGEGEGEDQCDQDTNKNVPALASSIYAGTRTPSLVPLDAAQQDAVVGISDAVTLPDFGTFCSGSLISEDVVLTAQHCTAGAGDTDLLIVFGVDEYNPKLVIASLEVHEHPDLDLAVIKLAEKPGDSIPVTPIPVALAEPPAEQIGSLVENAGYGDTDDGSEGRYFVTEFYVGVVEETLFGVDGQGTRGVCYGDSGGPMMHVSSQGDVRVLGALSFGDDPCGNTDYYQRADIALDFIEDIAGPMPRGDVEPCTDDITEEGRCSTEQTLAEYCENGIIVRDPCSAGEICSHTDVGARCVPTTENACGDVTTFGRCDGETLSWCDGEEVKTRACDACGERCLLASDTLGFACVVSDCGDIDVEGVCQGTVSKWCEDAVLYAEDCAAYDQTCEYIGPDLGYYCYDPVACEGLDYAGECDGSVVRWCQDNVPSEYDCAEDGLGCGFVEEEDGYNCQ